MSTDRKVLIFCMCGKRVTLEVVGGQYQDTYTGDCECGRKWSLTELSEILKEAEFCV